MINITFEKAVQKHKDTIFIWLDKPHVREFWDNSQAHRDDIINFMNGRKADSPYFGGIFDYWVGSIDNVAYCLLMTSEVVNVPGLPEERKPYVSKTGKTYSFDFMIGNEKYLGKGLAASTLDAFSTFIREKIDPSADTFIIDPAESNPRAVHVYEKAGFQIVEDYIQEIGHFKGIKHFLMVKTI